MEITKLIFFILSSILVIAVGYIMFSKDILRTLFAFALVAIALAGIYVLLAAELVAVIQLMIYAGGIVVIMVFGIMLTKEISENKENSGSHQVFPAALIFLIVLLSGCYMVFHSSLKWSAAEMPDDLVKKTGELFLTDHLLAFELVAFLLLVVLVGASFVAQIAKLGRR